MPTLDVSPPADPPIDPSLVASPGKRRRRGWGVGVIITVAALGAGVAFGAFVLDLGGSPGSPSPEPSVATTGLDIPAGSTAQQIFTTASTALGIPVEDFEAAAADPVAIGLPPEAHGLIEGWLGASTYQIPETATAEDVLSEMIDATLEYLDSLGVAPGDRLEVLTKASLTEREVRRDEDRPKFARVIENRLTSDMPLQLDSTVLYVVGTESAFTSAEDRAVDSPYNTYLYTGLPPGPICSPGLPAIDAALHPAEGTWLSFVVINLDTGEMGFATTFQEHQALIELLRQWMAANPD